MVPPFQFFFFTNCDNFSCRELTHILNNLHTETTHFKDLKQHKCPQLGGGGRIGKYNNVFNSENKWRPFLSV